MATKKKTETAPKKDKEVKAEKITTTTEEKTKKNTKSVATTEKTETVAAQESQEFSIEERLKSLYRLQKIMTKIDNIKILRGDLPLEVQDLKDEIVGLQTRLERYSESIKDCEKKIANNKNSIEESKIKIGKKKAQQKDVVNNREYEILSKEIENLELDVQIFDKGINEANAEIETRKVEYDELINIIKEKKDDLQIKEAELEQIIVETKKEEEELRMEVKELEENIDVRLLSAFKRIRKNARNGLAVVPIERNSCSGCFSQIPPQRQLDIRQRRKIIVCENCGRIIVDYEMGSELNL